MTRRIAAVPGYSLANLLLVLASGVCWILSPKYGIWFTLLASLPWFLQVLTGNAPNRRTPVDWLMVIVLITAWIGYWAAYDKPTAWIKVWLIVTAILSYYALTAQPKQNFVTVSLLCFYLGLGVAIYFFLTHNFSDSSLRIIEWWLNRRPQTGWIEIDHDYIAGLLAITNLFALYWIQDVRQRTRRHFTVAVRVFVIVGLGVVLLAFVLAMSRGILAAIACGVGTWVLWRFTTSKRFDAAPRIRSLFPVIVQLYIGAIIIFLFLRSAQSIDDSSPGRYGLNTRAEVFTRGISFILDYPFTGGGLGSFPGLYSQYILAIPNFYFPNSYNVFLDVAVEQGLLGGWAFLFIYLVSVWLVCQTILKAQPYELRFISWLSLFALIVSIVHGFLYDYLYYGNGTLLMFFPVGVAMMVVVDSSRYAEIQMPSPKTPKLAGLNKAWIIIPALGMVLAVALNLNKPVALWYANLGAVQMSQVELKFFPTGKWATSEMVPQLEAADASFRLALQHDPSNRTANYRLGLISMLRQDFSSAAVHLEMAHTESPNHRGIIKNLGYCYVWLGEMDKASALLGSIPEAQKEMSVYVWWWELQGRQDLSRNAFQQASRFDHQTINRE